jgi:excisionase family DNA binding protein
VGTTRDQPPSFVKPEDIAYEADVSVFSIYRLIKSGELAAVKVGRRWRIPREAAEALLGVAL